MYRVCSMKIRIRIYLVDFCTGIRANKGFTEYIRHNIGFGPNFTISYQSYLSDDESDDRRHWLKFDKMNCVANT